MYGNGLNSIRVRFTILVAGFTALGGIAIMWLDAHVDLEHASFGTWLLLGVAITAVPALVTYALAGRLTGAIGHLRASTEALAAGATDVTIDVDCPCEVGGLADSFRKMVARFNANVVRMNVLAYSDAVTTLPNRMALNQTLRHALAPKHNTSFEAALLFIDIDNFKQVNDTFGHEIGDHVLRQAADRILGETCGTSIAKLEPCVSPIGEPCRKAPDKPFLARFAGDEFVAVLPGAFGEKELEEMAQAVIAALTRPFDADGVMVSLGASIGITRTPQDARDADILVHYADLAMYAAKRAGRGGYAFFTPALQIEAEANLKMEATVRAAIERDDLILYFQPKLRVDTLEIVGVEALVRMRDETGKLVPPGDFIAICERCGLIERVGEIVLDKAVAQARAWLSGGLRLPVAINVSPVQFARPGFADSVLAVIEAAGIPGDLLEVEVTESTIMKDADSTERRIGRLRSGGVKVSIDDFGTGYSNISQLSRLSFDTLKIDRSLLQAVDSDPRGRTILLSVIELAERLGNATIVEGVETAEQLEFLRHSGCQEVQGFFFGRPMPAEDLIVWLAKRATGRPETIKPLVAGEPRKVA